MKILLIESNLSLNANLAGVLAANDYAITAVNSGQAGLDRAATGEYDLILLGMRVAQPDGITFCQQLRAQNSRIPILLVTTSDVDADVVAGLEAGADDYLSPFCTPEVLLAKVRTWLRRRGMLTANAAGKSPALLTWGTLTMDLAAGRVTCLDQIISLTATEYNLLELFLRNPNRIFSRSAILDRLWGLEDAPSDRAVITHIKDVRKKLRAGGLTEEIIETIYGMGYRLNPPPSNIATCTPAPPTQPQPSQAQDLTAIHAAVSQILERFRGVFQEQIAVLKQARTDLLAGSLEPALQQAAQQAAHKLAGSLASFGYLTGSTLARSAEHWLSGDRPFTPEAIAQFSQLITELQQEFAKPPLPATVPAVATVANHRVLMIDDDVALTERLQAESAAWGLRIKIAPNLSVARSLLEQATSEVVLLDLSFPETEDDGLTLLQELNQQFPELPVIVFTGRDSLSDRLAVSRLGARQFLPKPATTEQIFQVITRVLATATAAERKVLIVDDDPMMLAMLSVLLTPWGLDIVTLTEPERFWEVFLATRPHLVVLDLEMPQISGLDLCQVVRQDAQWGDLPILVVTGHTDADALQQAFAAGADDFITKPVLGPELVTRILSRLERTRFRQN